MDADPEMERSSIRTWVRLGVVMLVFAILVVCTLVQTKTIPNPLPQQKTPLSGYFIQPNFYDQGQLVDEIPISIRGPQHQTMARPDCLRGDCSIEVASKIPFEMPGPGIYHVIAGGYYSGYDVTDLLVTIPQQRGTYRVDFLMRKTFVYEQQLKSSETSRSALTAAGRITPVAKTSGQAQ
jgi:hypothetical protein